MNKLTFWSLFLSLLLLPNLLLAQCGVHPTIEIELFNPSSPEINSAGSALDSHWVVIQNQHYINGVLQNFNGAAGGGFVAPPGFSEITYRVTARDTISGDTCTAEYTNIFVTTGSNVFVGMDQISVNGMDVSIFPQFWGDYQNPGAVIGVIWGDGTMNGNFFHTYANPGIYNICVYVDNGFNIVQGCGVVHVSNGNPQLFNSSTLQLSSCQQVHTANYNSSPAHSGGFYAFEPLVDHTWNPPQIPAGGMKVDTFEVPGQYVNVYGLEDPNAFSQQIQYFNAFTVGTCDIKPDTVRGYCWFDSDQDGIWDSTETAATGETIRISNYSTTVDSNGAYEILMPRTSITVEVVTPQTSIPPNRRYSLSPNNTQLHENINFGIISNDVRIRGRVAYDANGDSIYNSSDIRLSNVLVTVENTNTGATRTRRTNGSGDYAFDLIQSNYKVYINVGQVDSAISFPDTIMIPSSSGNFFNRNFVVQSQASGINACVRMVGQQQARPGFPYVLSTIVTNAGTDTSSSTLTVNYDPVLSISSVMPANGVIDTIAYTVTWSVPPLSTANRALFKINSVIPISAPLGSTISHSADVQLNGSSIDYDLSNNSTNFSQILIGSYDPNDKLVNPEVVDLTPGASNPDAFFYHINFQNTGTASAINVVVQDEIDPLLDLTSLTMIDASHSYNMVINNRTVSWIFNNIYLPDSNANEPGSKGFIQYTIEPLDNLPVGSRIENTAAIYFDFNPPIITNTVATDYVISTGQYEDHTTDRVILFPNPVNEILNIRSNTVIDEVLIYNAVGALITQVSQLYSSSLQIDLSEYRKGIYLIQTRTGETVHSNKIIK